MNCKKCNGEMIESTAIQQGYSGKSEWPDGDMQGVTMSADGRYSKQIPCLKCTECGWSVTK